ncbi:O-antigen ligase family protein [Desemzia incerta]|uniref:O-antigen ligase family protein n=1 Tax=Desemzia incerta TaxID=82801 RepID=UPI001660772A|nr:O-antigen ligase family protein [Desemzia incerta]
MTEESSPIYFLLLATTIAIFLSLTKVKKMSIHLNYYYLSFILLMFFILVTYMVNAEFSSTLIYIKIFSIMILSFCISWLFNFKDFVDVYIKSLKCITVISLIFHVLINGIGKIITFPIISTLNASYYNGVVFFQLVGNETRNIGVFWEPGLFSSFLLIGMVLEISFKKTKVSYVNLLIFFLGILSTGSTAGYLLLMLVAILIVSEKGKNNNFQGFMLGMTILFSSVLLLVFYEDFLYFLVQINPELFSKLINESTNTTTRIEAPLLNMEIFKQNPFFGVGFSRATQEFISRLSMWNIDSQTSTSTYYLAAMGFPGLIYTFNWIKGTLGLRGKSFLSRITLCIIILIILNKEPHTEIVVTNCLMFFLIKETRYNNYNQKLIT